MNAGKLMNALRRFGFGSVGLKAEDFLAPEQVIQLGFPPNRIDIITSPAGVEFASCYEKRLEVEIDGVTVRFIDLENLKVSKKSAGRFQDLADIEHLE
jgi:hypothetical protein